MEKQYEMVMILTAFQCKGICKQALQPDTPIMVRSKADLIAAATILHGNSGFVCGDPRLIIMYGCAFVESGLLQLGEVNGKSKVKVH